MSKEFGATGKMLEITDTEYDSDMAKAYAAGRALGRREMKERALKVRTGKIRELARCGTGTLHGEQQYCFEKGWREGQAALRKRIIAIEAIPEEVDEAE